MPPLHWELICQNIPAAHCDHSVITPIILPASASPYHPATEMTLRGWQFNLLVTDGSYHDSTRAPALCCWFLFLLVKRGMLLEHVLLIALLVPPLLIIPAGPLGRDTGTCLCDPVNAPYTWKLFSCVRTYQAKFFLHYHPHLFSSPCSS